MKSVILIHNNFSDFSIDVQSIYDPGCYDLFLMIDPVGARSLIKNKKNTYFKRIFIEEDFTKELIIDIIKKNIFFKKIDFITVHESAVMLCGALKKHYGVIDEDYCRFVDKIEMKKRLSHSGILFPKYSVFDKKLYLENPECYLENIKQEIDFPIFAKPIDQAGSVGATTLRSAQDFQAWAIEVSRNNYQYELDEFIDGTLYHCESLLKNGEIIEIQVCEYSCPCFNFIQGENLGSISLPKNHPDFLLLAESVRQIHQIIARDISGVTHLELFKTQNGVIYFLEIAYRPPGVLASEMYTELMKISLPEVHILLQIKQDFYPKIIENNYAARYIFPKKSGVVRKFHSPEISSAHQFYWKIGVGENLKNSIRIRELAGSMLLWNKDYENLRKDFEKLRNFLPYYVE